MGVEAARLALRAPAGVAARRAVVLDGRAGLPRQDQRHRHPRRPAPRPRRARPRPGRRGPVGRRRAAGRPEPARAPTLVVVVADVRTGLPGSGDEAAGGDGAAALLVGHGDNVIAEHLGGPAPPRSSSTAGARRATPLEAVGGALRRDQVRRRSASGRGRRPSRRRRARPPTRSTPSSSPACTAGPPRRVGKRLGVADEAVADDLAATVGNTGAAHPALLLARALETARARPGDRAGRAGRRCRRAAVPHHRRHRTYTPARPVAAQVAAGADVPYGKFLAWRGMLTGRAAPPARAGAGVGVGGRPQRGLEVRLRRPATAAPARSTCLRRRSVPGGACGRRHGARADGRRRGHDRHLHRRPAGLLAEPADRVRGRRLRRRRPLPRRAHRRRRRRGGDRRPGGDDVPPAVHRRRHPQLLLEGPARSGGERRAETAMGSHGIKDRVAIVGMGCTPFGEHWDQQRRRPHGAGGQRDVRRRPASTKDDGRRLLARHGAVGHERHHAGPPARRSRASRSPGSRTTAPPAPRRCARPPTRWRRAPTTSPWPSASRR